jgi:hypothetical protein
MAAQIPVKAIYSGSDVTSLGEFTASDDITITYLPTGTSSSTVALGDHTHAYLPLAGGTLTGNLITTGLIDTRDVAADGVLATNAMPKSGGAFTGAITTNSTIDTVDIATRDGVLTTTTATAAAALPKAGGTMTGNIVMGDDTSIGISDSDERIEFDGAGDISILGANLGIGTSTPGALLEVASTSHIVADFYSTHATENDIRVGGSAAANDSLVIGFNQTANYGFMIVNGDAVGSSLVIADGGNVGIGTVSPSATLEVDGNVIAKTDTDTSNSGTVDLNFATNQNFVLTLDGNITSLTASNEVVGQSGFIAFIQDGTGSRTVALHGDYETPAAAGLTLTATASATDLVPYLVVASSRILLGAPQLAFA